MEEEFGIRFWILKRAQLHQESYDNLQMKLWPLDSAAAAATAAAAASALTKYVYNNNQRRTRELRFARVAINYPALAT